MNKFFVFLGVFFGALFSCYAEEVEECLPTCCGIWEVEVTALNWRTSTNNKLYALTADLSNTPAVEIDFFSTVKPEDDWGGRGAITYFSPLTCNFFKVHYTYFGQTLSDQTGSPITVSYFGSAVNQFSSINAEVFENYQRAGLNLGFSFYNHCCKTLYCFTGIDWLYLKEQDKLSGERIGDGTFHLNQKKNYNSVAFVAGFGGDYSFFKCFGIGAEGALVAAIGNRNVDFSTNTIFVTNVVVNKVPSQVVIVPGFDLKVEAFMDACMCCLPPFHLALGYEQHYFFDALIGNMLYFGPFNRLFPTQYQDTQNIGFGGLYLSAKMQF